MLYHGWKTGRCCNRCNFSLTTCIVLQQVAPFSAAFVQYIIHLLDRTETNIIFIWSGKVIMGEAKPSPNITLSDQINMILGEILSNKCFIIPATLCAPGPSHALLIQTKRPFTRYQCTPVQVCALRHIFSNVEFYCIRTGYTV